MKDSKCWTISTIAEIGCRLSGSSSNVKSMSLRSGTGDSASDSEIVSWLLVMLNLLVPYLIVSIVSKILGIPVMKLSPSPPDVVKQFYTRGLGSEDWPESL